MEAVTGVSTSVHPSADDVVLHTHTARDGLSDYSSKDAKWDVYRGQTELLADFLAEYEEFQRYATRMGDCGGVLLFGWDSNPETGETALKLKKARFCRCRHCATCAWRKTLAMTARFLEGQSVLSRDSPKARWLLLTLTVPNCPVGELADTLTVMNAAWNRLRLRREFKPVQGWARSTEVTQEKPRRDYAHPHFHVLMMVPPSMLSGVNYVKQARWLALWRECMRDDSITQVDVQAVKGDLTGAAAEVLKTFGYSVKPEQALTDPEWFLEMMRQVHRKRFFASGGALKEIFKEPETDEEMIEGDKPAEGLDDGSRLAFGWRPSERRYRRAPKADKGPSA